METKEVKGILYGRVLSFAETITPVYKVLGWKWHDESLPPSQGEIEQALENLIESFQGKGSLSTGGLTIFNEDGEVGISFTYCDTIYY